MSSKQKKHCNFFQKQKEIWKLDIYSIKYTLHTTEISTRFRFRIICYIYLYKRRIIHNLEGEKVLNRMKIKEAKLLSKTFIHGVVKTTTI